MTRVTSIGVKYGLGTYSHRETVILNSIEVEGTAFAFETCTGYCQTLSFLNFQFFTGTLVEKGNILC